MSENNKKSSSKAGTIAMAAIAGAIAWKVGSAVYKAWSEKDSN